MSLRYADNLSIGDEVLVPTDDKLTSTKVIHVSTLVMQGENHLKYSSELILLVV